jgi:AcrR family transcriptional regulator
MRTVTAPAEDSKPLRADARRNRARLLEAAEAVFTAKGPGASTEEVARQAGVGIGTVFRHFPTKENLLEAVYIARLHRLAEEARALSSADDPGAAFVTFFTLAVDQSAAKNAFADALADTGIDVTHAASAVGRELQDAVGAVLTHAQLAGTVRGDLGLAEFFALLVGASRATEYADDGPGVRGRILSVFLDGFRPPSGH